MLVVQVINDICGAKECVSELQVTAFVGGTDAKPAQLLSEVVNGRLSGVFIDVWIEDLIHVDIDDWSALAQVAASKAEVDCPARR